MVHEAVHIRCHQSLQCHPAYLSCKCSPGALPYKMPGGAALRLYHGDEWPFACKASPSYHNASLPESTSGLCRGLSPHCSACMLGLCLKITCRLIHAHEWNSQRIVLFTTIEHTLGRAKSALNQTCCIYFLPVFLSSEAMNQYVLGIAGLVISLPGH